MEKELISPYVFAERKGVSATIVYRKIKDGFIITEKVGKTSYIDWNKYNHIQFPKSTGIRSLA